MKKIDIYVLLLKGGRYYIGKSKNIERRYFEHCKGKGSEWTRLYPPIRIEKIIERASPFDEDKLTKEYMSKYGVENVRGGSYVEEELDDFQIEMLNREIWGAKNMCKRCGKPNHFEKDCYSIYDIDGYYIE